MAKIREYRFDYKYRFKFPIFINKYKKFYFSNTSLMKTKTFSLDLTTKQIKSLDFGEDKLFMLAFQKLSNEDYLLASFPSNSLLFIISSRSEEVIKKIQNFSLISIFILKSKTEFITMSVQKRLCLCSVEDFKQKKLEIKAKINLQASKTIISSQLILLGFFIFDSGNLIMTSIKKQNKTKFLRINSRQKRNNNNKFLYVEKTKKLFCSLVNHSEINIFNSNSGKVTDKIYFEDLGYIKEIKEAQKGILVATVEGDLYIFDHFFPHYTIRKKKLEGVIFQFEYSRELGLIIVDTRKFKNLMIRDTNWIDSEENNS